MAKKKKQIETLKHKDAKRSNIPTAEYQSVVDEETQKPIRVAIKRRNPDLDPQLVWRGKEEQNWEELVVNAPPLYIQEKIHPKYLIDDLKRQTEERQDKDAEQLDLFGDFNGLPKGDAQTEFYQHQNKWSNRMILGDSLQVMASLAEREGLRGKVQCIYFDPPYGIKFNSNFQWSTDSRTVKDGKAEHITREPEQVKAFRDTWKDGVHSYLSYLRDRIEISKDLLTKSGSFFLQIGDENVHLVRSILDEIFGSENFVAQITVTKTTSATSLLLPGVVDYIIWYARNISELKYNQLFIEKLLGEEGAKAYNRIEFADGLRESLSNSGLKFDSLPAGAKVFTSSDLTSQRPPGNFPVIFEGEIIRPEKNYWKTGVDGFSRLIRANRVIKSGKVLRYVRFFNDFLVYSRTNLWSDTGGALGKNYVVETNPVLVQRCIAMASDPGDLVIDPTCGSGTTAYVAEQWGRRWITIDTSRVALALARTRLMGARYPYYLLADSKEGQEKEAKITRTVPKDHPTYGDIRQGFVYERVPHIMLKDIANNAEIDVIYEQFQEKLEPLRQQLNEAMGSSWEEWEIPRELPEDAPEAAQKSHAAWWKQRIERQKEIDASIAAKADFEYLYDKPYQDKSKVRVAGPFTVESLSPHRMLGVDENGEPFDQLAEEDPATYQEAHDFAQLILNNLEKAGVQQSDKQDRIAFDSLVPWPGRYIAAEGKYTEADGRERRAGIFIGPEYGSVSRSDLVEAAKEAGEAGFDLVIACAFNYDAHSTEFSKLGRIPVLKARMNADLHMADDLAATGSGNLFVIFGEPDVDVHTTDDDQLQVQVLGIDIFDPKTGKVRSDDVDGIACWFVDTNYNGESFFVRHAYFLGANDPYQQLKRTLKAEVDEEAWETLYGDTSRPFPKPDTGRIAVKIINHLGDEVMKVIGEEEWS
jgi:adenine-specific DNA-methyltransferase